MGPKETCDFDEDGVFCEFSLFFQGQHPPFRKVPPFHEPACESAIFWFGLPGWVQMQQNKLGKTDRETEKKKTCKDGLLETVWETLREPFFSLFLMGRSPSELSIRGPTRGLSFFLGGVVLRAACLQNETAPKSFNFKTKNGPKNDPKLPRKSLSLVLLCRISHRHYSKIFHRESPHKIKYFFTTRICRYGHANGAYA